MKIPIKQEALTRTTLRLPGSLYAELQAAAEHNGRSLNAEVIARLQAASVSGQFEKLSRENAEIKALVRELLDKD